MIFSKYFGGSRANPWHAHVVWKGLSKFMLGFHYSILFFVNNNLLGLGLGLKRFLTTINNLVYSTLLALVAYLEFVDQ